MYTEHRGSSAIAHGVGTVTLVNFFPCMRSDVRYFHMRFQMRSHMIFSRGFGLSI